MKKTIGNKQTSSESQEMKDINLDLQLEASYLLSFLRKIGFINSNCVMQVSSFLFLIGWVVPCVLAYFSHVLLPGEILGKKCFALDLTMYAYYLLN